MGIFSFWTRRRNAKLIAQQAQEVARRSQPTVLDRVRRRAATMRIAEARGYVRSRALEIVHRELAALHKGRIPLEPEQQTQLISQATDTVVAAVLAELRSVPKAAKPTGKRAA
jgi:hypothetical protein